MIGDGVATRKDMFAKMKEVSGDDKKTRSKLGVESGKLKYPTFYEHPGTIRTGLTYMIRGPGTTDSWHITTMNPAEAPWHLLLLADPDAATVLGLRTLAGGRAVIDVEGESEIDEEGAWLFLDF